MAMNGLLVQVQLVRLFDFIFRFSTVSVKLVPKLAAINAVSQAVSIAFS